MGGKGVAKPCSPGPRNVHMTSEVHGVIVTSSSTLFLREKENLQRDRVRNL